MTIDQKDMKECLFIFIFFFLQLHDVISYDIKFFVEKSKIEACECAINHTPNIDSTLAVWKRKERDGISSWKKRETVREVFHAYFFEYTYGGGNTFDLDDLPPSPTAR